MDTGIAAVNDRIKEGSTFLYRLREEIGKVIVGQRYLVDRLLIGLLADGHVLLEGVPGLAKTLAVKTLAQAHRRQLPPHPVHARPAAGRPHRHADLQPARRRRSPPSKGPIFANLILADEINRAPAKVQSALLEAMQERQVTIGDETYRAAGPVPRAGHAEPDRAGRHLPAARGAGRPLHAQAVDRLSDARTRSARSSTAWPSTDPRRSVSAVVHTDDILAPARPRRPDLHRRQDQGLHRRPGVRDARARDLQARPAARSSSTAPRRAPRSTSRWPPRRTRSCRAAATSRRRTSSRSAPTSCATASSSPTRPRPRTSTSDAIDQEHLRRSAGAVGTLKSCGS